MQAWCGGCRSWQPLLAAGVTDNNSNGRAKVQMLKAATPGPAPPRAAVFAALTSGGGSFSREPRGSCQGTEANTRRWTAKTLCAHTQKALTPGGAPHSPGTCRVHREAHLQAYRHGGAHSQTHKQQEGPKLT